MKRIRPIFNCAAFCVLFVFSASGQYGSNQADADLNRVYHKMMGALPPAQRQHLLHAQRAWVAFKEKNEELLRVLVSEGAITEMTRQTLATAQIRARTFEIMN